MGCGSVGDVRWGRSSAGVGCRKAYEEMVTMYVWT